MEIRFATAEDSRLLSTIHAKSWKAGYVGMVPQKYLDELKEDFWVPRFQDWFSTGKATGQLLMDNGEALGCAVYGKSRDAKVPDYGEIITLYVLPEHWGKGVGTMLMKSVWADLKAKGFENAYLWALIENTRARKLYEYWGFQETSDLLEVEIMGQPLTDIRYTYAL